MPFCLHVLKSNLTDIEWTHDELDTLLRFKVYLVLLIQLNPLYCAKLESSHGLHTWTPIGKLLQGRKMLRASASEAVLNGTKGYVHSSATVSKSTLPPTDPVADSKTDDELLRGEDLVCEQTRNELNNSSSIETPQAEPRSVDGVTQLARRFWVA